MAGYITELNVPRVTNEQAVGALAYQLGSGISNATNKTQIYDYCGGAFNSTVLGLPDKIFEVKSMIRKYVIMQRNYRFIDI